MSKPDAIASFKILLHNAVEDIAAARDAWAKARAIVEAQDARRAVRNLGGVA